ncbi:MAG: efflux RND transporter permease subunit, partial [Planctomycetota bacterium]
RAYMAALGWSMRRRFLVAVAGLIAVAASVPVFLAVPREFVPGDVDEAEFQVRVTLPEGASVAAVDDAMAAVEKEVRGVRGVRTTLSTSGGGFLGQVNSGSVYVRLAPHGERLFSFGRLLRETLRGRPGAAFQGNYSQAEVMTEIDRRLRRVPDVRAQVRNFPSFNIGGGSNDIDLVLKGPELDKLYAFGETLLRRAAEAGGFRGLDTSLRLDKPELRVRIDRERAADLGARARDLGAALRLLVGGDEEVSRYRDPLTNEDYDVRLRLETRDRDRAELLDRLLVPATEGMLVELSAVASLEPAAAPSRIDRLDRQRTISVRGGVAPGYAQADRLEVLQRLAAELNMPAAYTMAVTGRGREMERTFREFAWAFLLSVIFMYLILASQFESLLHPLTILLSLPLSLPFALVSLYGMGETLNLYSALGILVLFGVVKKNAILQIDHMNGLRARGMPRAEAILLANRDRLRPILMTTFALVAGMLPLAAGTGPGAEERRAVAVVVIGGQTLCLLLTLLATPVAYSFFDDVASWFRRRRAEG